MSGNDELPEYLRGVNQPPPPSATPPPSQRVIRATYEDDEEEEDYGERPPIISPLWVIGVVGVLSVLCVGSLGSVVAGGSGVDAAQTRAIVRAGDLVEVVDQEGKVIDALASHGADRQRLQRAYSAIEPTDGLERGLKSLAFADIVQEEFVVIGDVRGTPLDAQHEKIVRVARAFDGAMTAWESAAGGTLGGIAVALGVAIQPPPRSE